MQKRCLLRVDLWFSFNHQDCYSVTNPNEMSSVKC